MSALATPPVRRIPLAAAGAGCAALAAALVAGPGGTFVPTALFGVIAVLLLLTEVGRRALQLLRSGVLAYLAVGVLVLLVAGVTFATILLPGLAYGWYLGGLFLGVTGLALVGFSAIEIRREVRAGRTPWQRLGGSTSKGDADATLRLLGPLLLGVLFGYAGLWLLGGTWSSMATFAFQGSPSALAFMVVLAVAVGLAAYAMRGAARGAQPSAPQRSEQAMAAHLHDSVLQTLALIQRQANDPQRVAQLARQQERSLRSWLAGRDERGASTLAGAVRAAAQEVEDESPGSVVEVVAVGDAPIDRQADAMVRAAREAMRNAVRHGGGPVRVFVEVEAGIRELFVRDTGPGFDLAHVGDERRGVRDAIIGRMEHVGGTAEIDSGPAGTEVALRVVTEPRGDDPFDGRE